MKAFVVIACAVVAYTTNVHLVLDVSPRCAVDADVVARHQRCNATPIPYFPAKVVGTDALRGNLILTYGYSAEPPENWTDTTSVPVAGVSHYECRDEEWKKGDAGRGFKYLPEGCNHTKCSVGCRVAPSGGCVEGDRIAFGGTCTTQCKEKGYLPSRAKLTCDLELEPRRRSFQCRATTTCEQHSSTANGSNKSCDDSTTLTTTLRTTDRVLRGCSELQKLRPGELNPNASVPLAVGMPNLKVESGGVYFEVRLEGSMDSVGWVDNAWNPDGGDSNAEHQWFSSPGAPGLISVTLQVLDDGIADAMFMRDGKLQKTAEILFEPPLIPVVLIYNRATWLIPEESWIYSPAMQGDIYPFTRNPFPSSCAYPPTVRLFDSPVECGDGFQQLNTFEECKTAAFTMGLEDITPHVGSFPGYPSGCFQCLECDLNGNLYLNENVSSNSSVENLARLLPAISAVCAWFDPRFTTTTLKKTTRRFTTTTLAPPPFKRSATCDGAFLPINHSGECHTAAAWLGFYDVRVKKINITHLNSDGNWPLGCFHCLICDDWSLFLNGPDQKDVDDALQEAREAAIEAAIQAAIEANKSKSGGNEIDRSSFANASMDSNMINEGMNSSSANNSSANTSSNRGRNLRRTSANSIGSDFLVELLCKSNTTYTTTPPLYLISTPQFVDVAAKTTIMITTTTTSTTTSTVKTTTATTTPNIMGKLTCKNPYGREEELPWWQQPAMLGIIGGSVLFCCCGCCACFIKGGFRKCCRHVKRCCCENRCMLRCKELCNCCSRKKKQIGKGMDQIEDGKKEDVGNDAKKGRMNERRNSQDALAKMGVVNKMSDAELDDALEEKKKKAFEEELARYEQQAEKETHKDELSARIPLSPREEQKVNRERRHSISSVFSLEPEEPETSESEKKKEKKKKGKEPPPVIRRPSLASLPGAAGRRNSLGGNARRPSLASLPGLGSESFADEILMSDARLVGSKASSGSL